MTTSLLFALNLVAILILVFGLYFPRHRRKDMVASCSQTANHGRSGR